MGLQTTVNINPALGIPGSAASFQGLVSTVKQYQSDGTAKAGSFALPSTNSVNTGGAAASAGFVGLTNSSATAAVGLVTRVISAATAAGTDASLVYPAGDTVTVALRGAYYIAATGSASVGQKVLVTVATGAISFGSSAGSGEIDTGWTVQTAAAAAGDIIIIANFG